MGKADYSVQLDEGLDMYDDASKRAMKKLEDLGLDVPDEPPMAESGEFFDGRMPANVASLGPGEIGTYLGLMTLYADFVEGQVTLAQAALLAESEKKELAEAAVRKSKTGTVQQKRDSALLDARYVTVNADYIAAKTYHAMLTAIAAAARRDVKFLSRLIETKRLQAEGHGRSDRVSNARGGGRGGSAYTRRRRN